MNFFYKNTPFEEHTKRVFYKINSQFFKGVLFGETVKRN